MVDFFHLSMNCAICKEIASLTLLTAVPSPNSLQCNIKQFALTAVPAKTAKYTLSV